VVGKNDSPVPGPEPETNDNENSEVWSVLLASSTVHVAEDVMSIEPGWADAVKKAGVVLIVAVLLLGLTMIDVTPVNTTVTVVDPVHAEHPPEEAVMVAEPVISPFTWPEACPTDTVVGSLEDHATPEVRFFWLPSL